jgi:hypothetical protein
LAKEAGQMTKFARCAFAKTTANYSNSFCRFHFISSVSRRQRPSIVFIKIRLLTPLWNHCDKKDQI